MSLVILAPLVAAVACGGASIVPVTRATGDETSTVVFDFAERVADGRFRPDGSVYDFDSSGFSQEQLVEGWSQPERSGDRRESLAWAMARRATLNLLILDTDRKWLHFRCRPFVYDRSVQQEVAVTINGVDVGSTELQPNFTSYALAIPRSALRQGDNLVTFEFTYAEVPQEHFSTSRDRRRLAASFDYVSISASEDPPVRSGDEARSGHRAADGRLVQPNGSEVLYSVTVPADGALEYSVTEPGGSTVAATGELVIRRPATNQVLLQQRLSPGEEPWRADLSRFRRRATRSRVSWGDRGCRRQRGVGASSPSGRHRRLERVHVGTVHRHRHDARGPSRKLRWRRCDATPG